MSAALLADRNKFSCSGCAAVPRLQKLNGCFTEIKEVVANYNGFEFKSCPVAAFGATEEYVGGLARIGTFKASTPREKLEMPSKLYQALVYCEMILKEEADNDDRA